MIRAEREGCASHDKEHALDACGRVLVDQSEDPKACE